MVTSYVTQIGPMTQRVDIRTSKRNIKGLSSIVAEGVVCMGAIIKEEKSSVVCGVKEVVTPTVVYRAAPGTMLSIKVTDKKTRNIGFSQM